MVTLTEAQRGDRDLREKDLQKQVTDLATIYGWTWVHFRPAQTNKGWRTPVEGPLGAGWPDLVLVHDGRQKVLFVELKRQTEPLRTEQGQVLTTLAAAGASVAVWRPSNMSDGSIQKLLGE